MARGVFEYDPETREFRRPADRSLPVVPGEDGGPGVPGEGRSGRHRSRGGDAHAHRSRKRRRRRTDKAAPPEREFRSGRWQVLMWLLVLVLLGTWVTMIVMLTRGGGGDGDSRREFLFAPGAGEEAGREGAADAP